MIDSYEIVRLSALDSGLETDIWLRSSEVGIKPKGKPYILVSHDNTWKMIFIDSCTNISPDLQYWLNKNTSVLMAHWDGKISDREILNLLSNNQ